MLIKVLPNKVVEPKLWEAIKYAVVQTDAVEKEHRHAYLNNLLHELLCGKAFCFVHIGEEDRRIKALLIAKVVINDVYETQTFRVGIAYAFSHSSPAEWDDIVKTIKKIATSNKCSKISFVTNNFKILEIGIRNGFVEKSREYVFDLGGY